MHLLDDPNKWKENKKVASNNESLSFPCAEDNQPQPPLQGQKQA